MDAVFLVNVKHTMGARPLGLGSRYVPEAVVYVQVQAYFFC